MNYLLDTHVLIDLLTDPQRVGRAVRSALEDPLNDVVVSSASAWEMAIKASIGRLRAPDDLEAELLREGIGSIDITMSDARAAGARGHGRWARFARRPSKQHGWLGAGREEATDGGTQKPQFLAA